MGQSNFGTSEVVSVITVFHASTQQDFIINYSTFMSTVLSCNHLNLHIFLLLYSFHESHVRSEQLPILQFPGL